MKVTLYLISLLLTYPWTTKSPPFYEQIAFEYFKKEIYSQTGLQELYVADELHDYMKGTWYFPKCFSEYKSENILGTNASGRNRLMVEYGSIVKKAKKGKRPINACTIVTSLDSKNGTHCVAVEITRKNGVDIYFIEMEDSGSVIRWCKGGRIF